MPAPRPVIDVREHGHARSTLARALGCSLALALCTFTSCAEHGPGNARTVPAGTPQTLVDTCSPCSEACVRPYFERCILGKVRSQKGTGDECLVYCVGQRETFGQSEWW